LRAAAIAAPALEVTAVSPIGCTHQRQAGIHSRHSVTAATALPP
jgi:hypothetical protein